MHEIIDKAVAVLKAGGTLLYPTDTIWGIGCDARNAEAIEKIYAIKQRDHAKSMLILCTESLLADCSWATETDSRPTTYILPASVWRPLFTEPLASNLPADNGSLGIRIVSHDFCKQTIEALGAPIVSTSANLSGEPSPATHAEIDPALMARIDYCVPPEPQWISGEGRVSRIVLVDEDGTHTIIRP